jgi:FKBP-type peptidyl-prolyl cis-trans isomerase FklB
VTTLKKSVLLIAGLSAAAVMAASGLVHQPPQKAAGPAAADPGYSIGFDLGRETRANLTRDGVTYSQDDLIRGFTDALRGGESKIPDAQMTKILTDLQKAVDERRTKERLSSDPVFKAQAEQADKASRAFMEKFAKLSGVKTLPSGVVYQVVKSGTGEPAKGASSVVVNFESYLSSGELVRQGREVTVGVSQLLPGAVELLNNMRVGDRWYAAIPPALAYGDRGNPPHVGPNEAIAVDVEILEVKK